jgi:hypothetical protein
MFTAYISIYRFPGTGSLPDRSKKCDKWEYNYAKEGEKSVIMRIYTVPMYSGVYL